MRTISLLFGITTIVIFLQLLLGGLLTFNFINAGVHIVVGILTLVLAIATMIAVVVSKPRLRSLLVASIALVLLIVLQIILGFDTLSNGSKLVAWIHFVNAMAIYGCAISGTFIASRIARPEKQQPSVGAK
jgi:heme A synthase